MQQPEPGTSALSLYTPRTNQNVPPGPRATLFVLWRDCEARSLTCLAAAHKSFLTPANADLNTFRRRCGTIPHLNDYATLTNMSFSLSALLNPEPSDAPAQDDEQRRSSTSIAAPTYTHSPEQHHAAPLASQPTYGYTSADKQDAAQALAKFAASTAPLPAEWRAPPPPSPEQRRPSNHLSIELPPPTTDVRKMSSPTLEHYHVASRSPEQQRRASVMTAAQPGLTLPPIQAFTAESSRDANAHASAHDARESQPMAEALAVVAHGSSHDGSLTESHLPSLSEHPQHQSAPTAPMLSDLGAQTDGAASSPAAIKQEVTTTPRPSSPAEARRPSLHPDQQSLKAVSSLKNEHGLRATQSPLRESSILPSTEMSAPEAPSKKRPAPSKKKGTATTSGKKAAPANKKRKLDPTNPKVPALKHSANSSSKGTPAASSPAPSTRSFSAGADADDGSDDEGDGGSDSGDLYCICRRPDNGTFMIGCDGTCDDWFHGKCVGIPESDKNLIDRYFCPGCEGKGVGKTTWKRLCRRNGCRLPARVTAGKNGKPASKYCSDECGVLFYREMVSRTRGREEVIKSRGARRRGTAHKEGDDEDDLGAKGGVLAAGEVKGLLSSSKTADDFKKLGDGVLSPPATPDGSNKPAASDDDPAGETAYNETELASLEDIKQQKEQARRRHGLLKDRMKFVTMVKQAASRTAVEREVKTKEYCGYDPRLEWTETQFAKFRDSAVGQRVYELETLAVEISEPVDTNGDSGADVDMDKEVRVELTICDRKKCARHLEWGKLCVDDLRFEMGDNSDMMRRLESDEAGIKSAAVQRIRFGGRGADEGVVERHEEVGGGEDGKTNGVSALETTEAEASELMQGVEVAPPVALMVAEEGAVGEGGEAPLAAAAEGVATEVDTAVMV